MATKQANDFSPEERQHIPQNSQYAKVLVFQFFIVQYV